MSTISEIIGWDGITHRVIAKGIDGELYAGNPELVAEIANDVYLQAEPSHRNRLSRRSDSRNA